MPGVTEAQGNKSLFALGVRIGSVRSKRIGEHSFSIGK